MAIGKAISRVEAGDKVTGAARYTVTFKELPPVDPKGFWSISLYNKNHFFAPNAIDRFSLGTYTILWLVERARAVGLAYVYLGYWVPESRKMAYKARFRPSEVLVGGQWRVLTDAEFGLPADSRRSLVPETTG